MVRVKATASQCTGCRICQLACALHHFGENNPKMSSIVISSRLLESGHYDIAVCDQCGICERVCPTGALHKVDGIYKIDPAECTWCRLCANECPQHAIVIPEGGLAPFKCEACGDCVELCPTSALSLVG